MDMSKLTHGAKLVLGTTIAYLIVSFLTWFDVKGLGGLGGVSGWSGIGFLAGLLAIAIIVWEALRLAEMKVEIGLTPAMVTAALSILLLIFAFIRFISKPGSGIVEDAFDRTIWAWIGLILAIAIVVSAWANMKMAGESVAEMGASMKAAASSAAASAKSATDSGSDEAAAPAAEAPAAAPPPPPPAAEAPAPPPPAAAEAPAPPPPAAAEAPAPPPPAAEGEQPPQSTT